MAADAVAVKPPQPPQETRARVGERRIHTAAIVRRTLEDMDPKFPKPDWDPADFKVV